MKVISETRRATKFDIYVFILPSLPRVAWT